ncbi:ABC transporter substrate-binding protein [Alcaligenaceae bacterium]|nr:ABC transporter substrate-binding protein [Alcaligenaceae bacterium]
MSYQTLKLRSVLSLAVLASAGVSMGYSGVAGAQTVTAVMHSALRVLDPVITTAYITRTHGYMIYDTLLATDANAQIQPQMVDKWVVSDDGKTYTFTLRPGLKWHDGQPVKSEDCIASIKRWAERDKMGQVLLELAADMKVVDDSTFQIVLTQPTNLVLRTLAKASGTAPFMMPKRIAETPSSKAITEHIGSGPFKWVAEEFKPGLKAVYAKNTDYVPRAEPINFTAGGKVVNVDRVVWAVMPDNMTAVNALMSGEIDYIEAVPYDLLPMLEGNKDLNVGIIDKVGYQVMYRMNFLHPPFDNQLVRQAAMYAVSQDDVMKALVGNAKYYKTCAALFGCGMPYESSYGQDMVVSSNIDKAKALLKQAGYDGTPVVILHPTDVYSLSVPPMVIASALRKAGFKVDLQAMDWQTVVTRRAGSEPPAQGGWNIFTTSWSLLDIQDPLRNATVAGNGKQAWFGWPTMPKVEGLRRDFALASDEAKLKSLAEQVQHLAIDEGMVGPLGQYNSVAAYRTNITNVPIEPIPLFWSMKKAGK